MCSRICRYIWYSYWAKVFWFHIESWPEWDSKPQPRAYRAHSLSLYIYIFCIYKSKNVRFQCCTQTYFSVTELVWVPKYWGQIVQNKNCKKNCEVYFKKELWTGTKIIGLLLTLMKLLFINVIVMIKIRKMGLGLISCLFFLLKASHLATSSIYYMKWKETWSRQTINTLWGKHKI